MVVLPALSKPTITILCSSFPKRLHILANRRPMVNIKKQGNKLVSQIYVLPLATKKQSVNQHEKHCKLQYTNYRLTTRTKRMKVVNVTTNEKNLHKLSLDN